MSSPTPPHATFRVIHQSSYDCQVYARALRTAERGRNGCRGEERERERGGWGGRRREEAEVGEVRRFSFRWDHSSVSSPSLLLLLLVRWLNRQPWQKEQMAVAIRDPRQHPPAWGPTVAPGETTWMTQGGMRAYGASARPAPELETPPLLHYILPLTQRGQLRAPSSSFRVITLFRRVFAHLSGRECDYIHYTLYLRSNPCYDSTGI